MTRKIVIEMSEEELKALITEATRGVLRDFQPIAAPPPPEKGDDLMSLAETAKFLMYSKATVGRNRDQWGLTPIRRGRELYFPTKQVHKLRETLFRIHGAPLPKEEQ